VIQFRKKSFHPSFVTVTKSVGKVLDVERVTSVGRLDDLHAQNIPCRVLAEVLGEGAGAGFKRCALEAS